MKLRTCGVGLRCELQVLYCEHASAAGARSHPSFLWMRATHHTGVQARQPLFFQQPFLPPFSPHKAGASLRTAFGTARDPCNGEFQYRIGAGSPCEAHGVPRESGKTDQDIDKEMGI